MQAIWTMPANPHQTLGTTRLTRIACRDLYSSSSDSQLDDRGAMLDRVLGPTDMLQRTDKSSTLAHAFTYPRFCIFSSAHGLNCNSELSGISS